MWYCRVAAVIWEYNTYDIENMARGHNDLKILGHRGPILGLFRSFCEILGFLGQKPNFRFFRSAGRPALSKATCEIIFGNNMNTIGNHFYQGRGQIPCIYDYPLPTLLYLNLKAYDSVAKKFHWSNSRIIQGYFKDLFAIFKDVQTGFNLCQIATYWHQFEELACDLLHWAQNARISRIIKIQELFKDFKDRHEKVPPKNILVGPPLMF